MYITYTSIFLLLHFFLFFVLLTLRPKQESKMVFMIFTMANGLSLGLFAGILFHANLFTATLTSIGIIAVLTVLLGMRINYHHVMESFYSGIMSAMMGAMLNVMVSEKQGLYLLLLSLLCLLCTTVLELKQRLSGDWSKFQLACGLGFSLVLIVLVFISFPKTI